MQEIVGLLAVEVKGGVLRRVKRVTEHRLERGRDDAIVRHIERSTRGEPRARDRALPGHHRPVRVELATQPTHIVELARGDG